MAWKTQFTSPGNINTMDRNCLKPRCLPVIQLGAQINLTGCYSERRSELVVPCLMTSPGLAKKQRSVDSFNLSAPPYASLKYCIMIDEDSRRIHAGESKSNTQRGKRIRQTLTNFRSNNID